MTSRSLLNLTMAATLLAATSACASGVYYRSPAPIQRSDARAYRNGFDAGRSDGIEDARRGRRFDYDHNRVYRSADRGFDGGNRRLYQNAFREGYASGYNEGYRGYARDTRDNRRDDDRNGPFTGGHLSRAADTGFRDGYEQGRKDARDGDRFDPIRAPRYREGDHDYNSRDGSRDVYKREYRNAFQQGYERGYREIRR